MTESAPPPARAKGSLLRSALAILAGLAAVIAPSLIADQVMRALGVFPSAAQPMQGDGLFAIAFGYRSLFAVLGGYVAARLAPDSPVRHAFILGGIGTILAGLGVAGALAMDIRPFWYPVGLFVVALPLSWLGGALGSARGKP